VNYYATTSDRISLSSARLTMTYMILAGLSVLWFLMHSSCGARVGAASYVFCRPR